MKTIHEKSGPKYLLDACVPIRIQELSSREYIESTQILSHNAPDDVVLEEAKKLGLVVITMDVRFVLRCIIQNEDIIYQNAKGERYYIDSSSQLFATDCIQESVDKRTKYLLRNDVVMLP